MIEPLDRGPAERVVMKVVARIVRSGHTRNSSCADTLLLRLKRVSRMAANIPFIRANLSPLSFTDLPRGLYAHAILGVYELNRIELLRDVFIWSYERSAERYAAVRQSLGEPDPFRLRHRDALRAVVAEVVQGRMDRKTAAAHIASWATAHLEESDRAAFREVAETELLGLHEGNFARYPIRPGEFTAWQEIWSLRGT